MNQMGQPQVVVVPVEMMCNINLIIVTFKGLQMRMVSDPLLELAQAGSAIIKQQIELLEIMTGCETKNRYHVYIKTMNGEMSYLFKCKEESSWCSRNCLRLTIFFTQF